MMAGWTLPFTQWGEPVLRSGRNNQAKKFEPVILPTTDWGARLGVAAFDYDK